MTLYNGQPASLGVFHVKVEEVFKYVYLPIKLAGDSSPVFEDRLKPITRLVSTALCDYIGTFGLNRYIDRYVYVTAIHDYQDGHAFNRPGWHSDGFGTDDISYIWSNMQPTVFNYGDFYLSDDDVLSMRQMEEQADQTKNFRYPNGSLLRLDETVIHKVADPEIGMRLFVKIVISQYQFNLIGNSINRCLNYKWEYIKRKVGRNIPHIGAKEVKDDVS